MRMTNWLLYQDQFLRMVSPKGKVKLNRQHDEQESLYLLTPSFI